MTTPTQKTLTVSHNTVISISLMLTIVGAAVFNEVRMANVMSTQINEIEARRDGNRRLEDDIKYIKTTYSTKQEMTHYMEKIDLKMDQLLKSPQRK